MNQNERDVTHSSEQEWKRIANQIFLFLKHPIEEVARLPDWGWKTLILLSLLASVVSGLISGLIPPKFYHILAGLLLFPVMSLASGFILSLFFYYFFQIFERKTVSFKGLYTLVFFANLPFFVFRLISNLLPFITVIGFAFTALLLIVGLVENFSLSKQRAIKLVGGIFILLFAMWAYETFRVSRLESLNFTESILVGVL